MRWITSWVRLFKRSTARRSPGAKFSRRYWAAASRSIDRLQVVPILHGVVTPDSEHLCHTALSWPAREVHQKVQSVADVASNRPMGEFDAGHQHTGRETSEGLRR